ncbi:MAG: sigma-70 family RNA polymerase sigma factor [Firmicutes bacterium]|nr:sigma-70 family RNA polymerase sigma factor [Bacillota bacterium]
MRSEAETHRAIALYGDMIKRICLVHLKNETDTEDIFQTVFLKYILSSAAFQSDEHEKAWFIRVTINCCKDVLKSFFRKNRVSLEEVAEAPAEAPEDYSEVMEAVLSLPDQYKDVVYLYYYEEYSAEEISRVLNKNVNTVYTWLRRGRLMLREKLGGNESEEQDSGRF